MSWNNKEGINIYVYLGGTFEVLTENIVSCAVVHGFTLQKKNCDVTFVG